MRLVVLISMLLATAAHADPAVQLAAPQRSRVRFAVKVAVGALAVASLAIGAGLYASAGAEFDRLKRSCAPTCLELEWAPLQQRERAGVSLFGVAGAAALSDAVLWIVRF